MSTPQRKNRNRSSTIRPRPISTSPALDQAEHRQVLAEQGEAGLESDEDEDDSVEEEPSIVGLNNSPNPNKAISPRHDHSSSASRNRRLLTSRPKESEWKVLVDDTGQIWGRYFILMQQIAHEIRSRIPEEYSAAAVKTHLKAVAHPRRRLPLLLLFVAGTVFYYTFIHHDDPIITAASHFTDLLSSDSFYASRLDHLNGRPIPSANKAKVLESYSNPYGFINLVDPYAGGVFNPSILVLPDTVGQGWKHLLVARGAEKYEVLDGEDVRWESVVAAFMLPLIRPHLSLPYLARESDLEKLELPAERKMDFVRCEDPTFDQFIGAEDPRLFFTNIGQPLLIYSQTGRSPRVCRAIHVIDARVVIPELGAVMKRGGWNPPIVFKDQTDLIREGQFDIEKNWSPFLGESDDLFFHVSLVPQLIYKYIPGLTLRPLVPNPPLSNCLTQVVSADMNRVKFHHATPLLRATLCRRGECVPDVHNTVLFGMIHIKYHPLPYLFYERRIVTWNTTAPYEYLSVSKPLTYSGTNQADPIFTTSIAWDHPTKKGGLGLNHGFLNEVVITSFGVGDYGSAYIDVLARDLLSEHHMCTGAKGFSLF